MVFEFDPRPRSIVSIRSVVCCRRHHCECRFPGRTVASLFLRAVEEVEVEVEYVKLGDSSPPRCGAPPRNRTLLVKLRHNKPGRGACEGGGGGAAATSFRPRVTETESSRITANFIRRFGSRRERGGTICSTPRVRRPRGEGGDPITTTCDTCDARDATPTGSAP